MPDASPSDGSPVDDEAAIERAAASLRAAADVVAFTGAGISTESGVPDFRSPGGVWDRFDPRDFTIDALREDPVGYWERRLEARDALDLDWDAVEPNPAHEAIATLERAGGLSAVVTQNVDGLHGAAGTDPDRVHELHGTRTAAKCLGCGQRLPLETLESKLDGEALPPTCDDCDGLLKRATVSFGERLPPDVLSAAEAAVRRCDCLLVVGSSLTVEPAASLPRLALRNGADLVIVNLEETGLEDRAVAVIHDKAGEVLPEVVDRALGG